MNIAHVQAIADAVMYEGYMLYPYRHSAIKNQVRWLFGVVYPPGEAGPSSLQSECLVTGDPTTLVEGRLRFLHPGEGGASNSTEDGDAALREIDLAPARLAELMNEPQPTAFTCGEGRTRIDGNVVLSASEVAVGSYRLRVTVANASEAVAVEGLEHHQRGAMGQCLVSTHVLLGLLHGEFVPPRNPPPTLLDAVDVCRNDGLWPILVGRPRSLDTILCSPIILDDYPEVAPESPGNFFESTDMDELLTLRILTLTADEKREMAAASEQTSRLLERTEQLGMSGLAQLHGTFRTQSAAVRPYAAGDRVRLRPQGRADIFDLALAGREATVESVEVDYDGRTYIVVSVDDDPGKDLAAQGRPGHRFFFSPDEVEPLTAGDRG